MYLVYSFSKSRFNNQASPDVELELPQGQLAIKLTPIDLNFVLNIRAYVKLILRGESGILALTVLAGWASVWWKGRTGRENSGLNGKILILALKI